MANYAEELAYWYLRLNGFFLVSNYVYHQIRENDDERAYNADADLLAIRPPHYFEEIPHLERGQGRRNRYVSVPLASDGWLDEFNGRWLGVVVEVKGSDQIQEQNIARAFSPGRLQVALHRLGLIADVGEAVNILSENLRCDYAEGSIIKLVFSARVFDGPWMTIPLHNADQFIVERMTSAQNQLAKLGGRYFFPSELIQYMIWSANRQQR